MASLTPKIINGHKYYYARISKRVNGKPKIVQTIYLGTVDKIIKNAQAADQIPQAKEVYIAELGATAALFDIAKRLQFVEIIDSQPPKLSYSISRLNETQKKLYDLLDLGRFRQS